MKNLVLIILLFSHFKTSAEIFLVDLTFFDGVDTNPGDGVCHTVGDFCSLRAAIMEANQLSGPDAIVLPANTTINLLIQGIDEDDAATGDLDISDSLHILTTGVAEPTYEEFATISAQSLGDRIFDIKPNAGIVTFEALRIISGDAQISNPDHGGGIYVGHSNDVTINSVWFEDNLANNGGAIHSNAENSNINIFDSVFIGNAALNEGSAIASYSRNTVLERVSIIDNLNFSDDTAAVSALVAPENTGAVELINVTIFNNNQSGIRSEGGDLIIRNSTVVDNGAFGVFMNGFPTDTDLLIQNSILYSNDVNCSADPDVVLSTNNYNISETVGNCFFLGKSTNYFGNPLLGPLKIDPFNWHRYLRPSLSSQAVNNAHPDPPGTGDNTCDSFDQLRLSRNEDGGNRCDRGAIEVSSDIVFYDEFETI